jgi:hypothetical protein
LRYGIDKDYPDEKGRRPAFVIEKAFSEIRPVIFCNENFRPYTSQVCSNKISR